MSVLTAKLRQQAGQEGHDGEPWDSMSEAADEVERLQSELAEARNKIVDLEESDRLWNPIDAANKLIWDKTSLVAILKRAEKAEKELAEARKQFTFAVKQRVIADEARQEQIYRVEKAKSQVKVLVEALERIKSDTILDKQDAEYYKRIIKVHVIWIEEVLASIKEPT
jgi:hypothetical protein